jgi:6,7-dimethyl-8-ribityllumazine synthase
MQALELKGNFNGKGLTIGIVVSRFNELVTKQLLEGALDTLQRTGVKMSTVKVVWVPGAFELPLAAQALANQPDVQGVIALGCVIRGATTHYDYVCSGTTSGLQTVALATQKPVVFGVLTTETLEQALERSGSKGGNKGSESALTVVEMIGLLKQITA